jgi:hypothetical protein
LKEIALVLAVGNLIALNLLVLGVLFIAYRAGKAKAPQPADWPQRNDTVELPPR